MENQSCSNILNKQFIFIIGSPRSGTTWLQTMLGAHPLVCTTVELTLFTYYTGPWIKIWKAEADNIAQGRWHAGLPFLWTEKEFYEFLRDFLARVYTRVLETKPQATHILDKHPGYSFNIEDIHTLLPHARFIHLIRDGRDTALSMIAAHDQIGFGIGTIEGAAFEWTRHVQNARIGAQYPEQYLEVRYEALLSSGVEVLQSIFDFCNLSISLQDVMAIFDSHRFEKMKSHAATVVSGIKAPAGHYRKGRVGDWRQDLCPRERYLFEKIAGDLLNALDYAESGWWFESRIEQYLLPLMNSLVYRKEVLKKAIFDLLGPTSVKYLDTLRSRFKSSPKVKFSG